MDSPILFFNRGLLNKTPDEYSFKRADGTRCTIRQHFEEHYRVHLRFPGLPCVIQRKSQCESYYPMEVLKILGGQCVPIEKQTPNLVEQMVQLCEVLPANLRQEILKQQAHSMTPASNPYFRAHGIQIDSELLRTNAQLLHLPAIQYANDRVEPTPENTLSNWTTIGPDENGRKFLEPAEFPKTWAVAIVKRCAPKWACHDFCDLFVRTARCRGLTDCGMPTRVDHFEQTDMEYMDQKFQLYKNSACRFLLCLAPGKKDAYPGDIHQVLKSLEQKYGVLTQHISPEVMKKCVAGGDEAAMIIENILMKTNMKLGGANNGLTTSTMFKRAARSPQDILGDIWLGGKRMFIGIDLSHAPELSIFGKADSFPNVIGMAWTVGKNMVKMRGTYWMHQPSTITMKEQYVLPLVDNIRKAILQYRSESGNFPDHIIVFRGGVSEDEFKSASFWEGNSFVHACKQVAKIPIFGPKFQPPAVTMVVCDRQSNYRMIPTNVSNQQATAPEQNVQPGTVVDRGVMDAAMTEFLLVAQQAVEGTAEPVRCTVVYKWRPQMGPASQFPLQMPLEEIENITNALCWSHGICTDSTAVPGVLYAAGELAKRGRNIWKMHISNGADVPHFDTPQDGLQGSAAEQAQQRLDDQRAQYFYELSQRLEPNIPTKFWA